MRKLKERKVDTFDFDIRTEVEKLADFVYNLLKTRKSVDDTSVISRDTSFTWSEGNGRWDWTFFISHDNYYMELYENYEEADGSATVGLVGKWQGTSIEEFKADWEDANSLLA